jgi:predicted RNA binding protein YcfA (HicA-like mRNA interferase family)
MGSCERLRQDLLRGRIPTEAKFEDVKALYEEAGWELDRTAGSHHQFTKAGERTEPVVEHDGKVERPALRKLAKALKG